MMPPGALHPIHPMQEGGDNPWWGRLLGWPLIAIIVLALLLAPLAVKLLSWIQRP